MATIHKTSKQKVKEELERNKKIKPKLQKFLIDAQVNKAAQTAKEMKEQSEKNLSRVDLIKRCAQLAAIAFLDKRIWEKSPLPVEMKWTQSITPDGKFMADEDMKKEMEVDISGFSSYLVREYNKMEKEIKSMSYPNPTNESNLDFFWNKFAMDLRLLILADMARIQAGNKGVVVTDGKN